MLGLNVFFIPELHEQDYLETLAVGRFDLPSQVLVLFLIQRMVRLCASNIDKCTNYFCLKNCVIFDAFGERVSFMLVLPFSPTSFFSRSRFEWLEGFDFLEP